VLTVTDICGNTASSNVVVTVDQAPTADAGANATICQSDTYTIDATGTGVGITYSWNPTTYLDNPNIEDPVFGPAPVGTYILTLSVTDIYNCPASDDISITVLPEQTITIPAGLSGISSYLNPDDPDIYNMFDEIDDNLIILWNSNMYYSPPSLPSPPSVQWNPSSGYYIRMALASDLIVCGTPVAPVSINLVTGWNVIPVSESSNISIVPDLSDIPQIQVVSEIGLPGRFWWRNGASSLNVLETGKAYRVQASGPCVINFAKNSNGSNLSNPSFTNTSPWNEVSATVPAHLFAFISKACSLFEPGDIVGAFTPSGLCAGMWGFSEKESTLGITAFGDDDFTEVIDGFVAGESVQFQMYRPSTGDVFDLNVIYDPASIDGGVYTEDGLSLISEVGLSLLGNRELANSSLHIYPNPGHGIFNIVGLHDVSDISVLNSTGLIIYKETIDKSGILNLASQPKGIYFVKITINNEVIYRKIIIQ